MKLRALGNSGLTVSEVGLGCEHLQGKDPALIRDVIDAALHGGVNTMDVFMSEPDVRSAIGAALAGRRSMAILQGHIGAAWIDGQYSRTRDLAMCKRFFEDFMERLRTDYVDIGMLHFVDTEDDLAKVLASGMIEYACDLKQKGVIRAVGVSSHDPVAALKLVETGKIDVLMFSINPAYDALPADANIEALFDPKSYAQDLFTIVPERQKLYQTCEKLGVGITVMKALGAGALLRAKTSPFAAMSVPKLIHYALSRPAVASVLVGCRSVKEVEAAVAYETASEKARDFAAVLAKSPKFTLSGRCMYCNHCLPCPSHIDIAAVNKYLDLAQQSAAVPDTVRAHYHALARRADECVQCGACEKRCPFGVPVRDRMKKAAEIFGV